MPSWFYGPNDEAGVFDACPEGWADHPCKCLKPKGGDLSAVVEAVEQMAADVSAFDHDGDGRPGGSKPRRKKAVRNDPRK